MIISSSQKLRGWLAFSGVRVGRTGTHAGQAGVQKERDCARREAPRWALLDGGAPAAGTSLGSVLDHRMNTSCSGSSPPPSSAAKRVRNHRAVVQRATERAAAGSQQLSAPGSESASSVRIWGSGAHPEAALRARLPRRAPLRPPTPRGAGALRGAKEGRLNTLRTRLRQGQHSSVPRSGSP